MINVSPLWGEGDRHVLEVPVAGGSPAEVEHVNRGTRAVKGTSAAHGDGAAPHQGYSPLSHSVMVRDALQPSLSFGMEATWAAASSLLALSPAPWPLTSLGASVWMNSS